MSNGMSRAARSVARVAPALLLMGGMTVVVSGCGSAPETRPMVPTTAAQLYGSDPAYELDFYDRLDRLPVVSYDDAIHSVLLLNGQSAFSYPQRVAMAKQQGLLEENFDRPPREAVTIGEVAVMIERVITDRVDQSYDRATARLASRGILPESARPNQGLTGSQMLAVLGATEDFLLAQGEAMDEGEPLVVIPPARPQRQEPAAVTPPAPAEDPAEEDVFAGFEEEPRQVVRPEQEPPVTPAPQEPERQVVTDVEPLPDLPEEEPAARNTEERPAPPPALIERPETPQEDVAEEAKQGVAPPPAPPAPVMEDEEEEAPPQPAAKPKKSKWVPGKPLRQGGR